MRKIKFLSIYSLLFFSLLVFSTPPAIAAQGSLNYCQNMSDKIRYYTNLRRKGGSAKRMENWKNQRKNYQGKFNSRNCKKWRDQLSN